MTEQEQATARTLAAYALNLMHGATLADFERDNLIALAESVGATVGPPHWEMARLRDNARADEEAELMTLRAARTYTRRPWWRFWQ